MLASFAAFLLIRMNVYIRSDPGNSIDVLIVSASQPATLRFFSESHISSMSGRGTKPDDGSHLIYGHGEAGTLRTTDEQASACVVQRSKWCLTVSDDIQKANRICLKEAFLCARETFPSRTTGDSTQHIKLPKRSVKGTSTATAAAASSGRSQYESTFDQAIEEPSAGESTQQTNPPQRSLRKISIAATAATPSRRSRK